MAALSLSRILAHWAAQQPDRVAVSHEDRDVTFAQLEASSNRLARAYEKRGVSADDFVTIALPNSIAFYSNDHAAMLANFTGLDQVIGSFGITHILVSPGDYVTEFETEDRKEIIRLLLENPAHKTIYSADGFTVREIEHQDTSSYRNVNR